MCRNCRLWRIAQSVRNKAARSLCPCENHETHRARSIHLDIINLFTVWTAFPNEGATQRRVMPIWL